MRSGFLLHNLIGEAAHRAPRAGALTHSGKHLPYAELDAAVRNFASGLLAFGLQRADRIAIFLDKRPEFVIAAFGASAAGCVFVPVNPILKADQVGYILRDCNVRLLVTTAERAESLRDVFRQCPDLTHRVVIGDYDAACTDAVVHRWADLLRHEPRPGHRAVDSDMAAILYTSGSTGSPKGVVVSHRNVVTGARSVASYLENDANDVLLAALPLSFDAGFSQLTTAFTSGARVVLLNYLLPRDVLKAITQERVTGLTAVPPLYIQLSQLEFPRGIDEHLRYFANTGGRMPLATLTRLRQMLPRSKPYLMYGLTEAFRATYLPPSEVDRRPDSIGKAIPNSEVLVLREDGSECGPNEPGELVQRGALVAMGYWNDVARTAERFKPLPAASPGRQSGLVLPEIAVFSGDTVTRDDEGFLYFVGRRDEMIKTSGYRVSPSEVEEILYATNMVGECAAFGVPHETLGQSITVVVTPSEGMTLDVAKLLAECRTRMPAYMVPADVQVREGPLPRNANGKIDRRILSGR